MWTSRRIRILILEPAGLFGGSERALLDLLAHIDRACFEAIVVCPRAAPLRRELDRLGVAIVDAPLELLHLRGRLARVQAAWSIASIIRRCAPDVVHVNQAGLLRIAALACRLTRTPLICHVRLLEDARRLRAHAPGWLRPRRYVVVSDVVRNELGGDSTDATVPIIRIYDPLDVPATVASAEAWRASEVRGEFSIPATAKIVALVGRLCADKRQNLLIEAAAELRDRDCYFLIVGSEPIRAAGSPSYLEELRKRSTELGVEGRVLFTGMRMDVPAIMRECDVVVLASQEEALGRVLLEALSLGTPIVGPAAGGPGEIVGRDERGLAFEVDNARSLAQRIEATFADSRMATLRTERGARWVSEHCAPSAQAREVERLYEQLSLLSGRASTLRAS